MGGKLQFSLPGQPIFPALGDDTILKPALDWILYSAQPARFDAELSYVTGGMSWSSDYNIVAPETGDTLDLVGWVTLDNQSGKQFDHAHIKLMAGDVNKVQPPTATRFSGQCRRGAVGSDGSHPGHREDVRGLPPLHAPATRPPSTTVKPSRWSFCAPPASSPNGSMSTMARGSTGTYGGYQDVRQIQQYGTQSNPHVWVMREFDNSDANHLGVPLPKGRVRFYRRDQDGQVEFTGENEIDHTPKDETVRVYTGNAFDITGERRQTRFQSQISRAAGWTNHSRSSCGTTRRRQ